MGLYKEDLLIVLQISKLNSNIESLIDLVQLRQRDNGCSCSRNQITEGNKNNPENKKNKGNNALSRYLIINRMAG